MRILIAVLLCAVMLVGAFLLLHIYHVLGNSVAVVDVNKILTTGTHSVEAFRHNKQAQEIYQYNLDVIEKKLATYKNKQQAQAYLREAARQLQIQLNTSRVATTQAMGAVIKKILDARLPQYDIIIDKSNALAHVKAVDITDAVVVEFESLPVVWPALPRKIDTPNLPPDTPPAGENDNTPAPQP